MTDVEYLQNKVAELESEKAHLIGAMQDQWVLLERAMQALREAKADK